MKAAGALTRLGAVCRALGVRRGSPAHQPRNFLDRLARDTTSHTNSLQQSAPNSQKDYWNVTGRQAWTAREDVKLSRGAE
jgi:hypothetical protein